jgi:hypothetical protein
MTYPQRYSEHSKTHGNLLRIKECIFIICILLASVFAAVNCKVRRLSVALQLPEVPSWMYKVSINPIIKSKTHRTPTRDNILLLPLLITARKKFISTSPSSFLSILSHFSSCLIVFIIYYYYMQLLFILASCCPISVPIFLNLLSKISFRRIFVPPYFNMWL